MRYQLGFKFNKTVFLCFLSALLFVTVLYDKFFKTAIQMFHSESNIDPSAENLVFIHRGNDIPKNIDPSATQIVFSKDLRKQNEQETFPRVRKSVVACREYTQRYGSHTFKNLPTTGIGEDIHTMRKQIKKCMTYLSLLSVNIDFLQDPMPRKSGRKVRSLKDDVEQLKNFVFKGMKSNMESINHSLMMCIEYLEYLKFLIPEFPHMAALGYQVGKNEIYEFQCGGALISNKFVLTAAHCVTIKKPLFVRMGTPYIPEVTKKLNNNFDYKISRIVQHEKYNSTTHVHDIALLELEKEVVFSDIIHPACLHAEEDRPQKFVICGWGKYNLNSKQSKQLLKSEVQLSSEARCLKAYPETSKAIETIICVEGAMNACNGDSGSPMQIKNESMFVVVGVTSGGKGCGAPIPVRFTRTFYYLDWIESKVWPEDS